MSFPEGPAPAEVDDAHAAAIEAAAVDTAAFKRAVGSFATGVTVVTTRGADDRLLAFTANSFTSVSLDPPLVLICLNRRAPSMAGFAIGRAFVVNILAADQQRLSGHFARPSDDKLAGIEHRLTDTGIPVLTGTHATLECRLEHWFHGGDHVILVGRVEAVDSADNEPLVFHRSRYTT